MKKKIVVIFMLISSSVFANNMALIEQIQEIKIEIQLEAQSIGEEAYRRFENDSNSSKSYIEEKCQDVVVHFDYLESENIIENLLFPNCLEFAIEAMNKE